jgi:hypothetical protein
MEEKTKEPTFQETYKLLEKQGWEKISPSIYKGEKATRKHQTARVGLQGFFRLKVSNEELKKTGKLSKRK